MLPRNSLLLPYRAALVKLTARKNPASSLAHASCPLRPPGWVGRVLGALGTGGRGGLPGAAVLTLLPAVVNIEQELLQNKTAWTAGFLHGVKRSEKKQ